MRLLEVIGRWMGRVEVVLAGAEDELRAGEEALAVGEPMRARALAKAVLERLPGSPLGLALLADACEAAGLDAELALTLEELAGRIGSSADVWIRLARARQKTEAPIEDVRSSIVRALALAEAGSDARRDALLFLADLDLASGEKSDGARAELWLERLADRRAAEVAVRRAEARLLQQDVGGALAAVEGMVDDPTDARAALTRGRILALASDAAAFPWLIRAYVLEAPHASEYLSSALAWIASDEATRARVRLVVEHRGEEKLARWRAAFARAEGQREEARAALRDALSGGDHSAAKPLLDAALEDGDAVSLKSALEALAGAENDPTVIDAAKLPDPAHLGTPEDYALLLDRLATVTDERARPWSEAVKKQIALRWIPPKESGPAAWAPLLARLDTHARQLHELDVTSQLAELAIERTRPVRLAIVGEFNAGKSTFINALMGADVAPTGVLPTTATLHHLRYAPDPIARILMGRGHDPPERIVPVSELRATLKALGDSPIRRVEIQLPLPSLTRVEIIDTPGFNAPDVRHTEAARSAFEEADSVLWLLDAAQPLKQSERLILDEAKNSRISVQMLVNKADRLAPADLEKVMAMVKGSLEEIGLTSWAPPLALSARLALAGRLGDEKALAASGWNDVQALLDEQIVGRSAEMKERALRRRALRIVTQLHAHAKKLGDEERAHMAKGATRAKDMRRIAAALDRDAEESAKKLSQSLAPSIEAWSRDLSVITVGRDRETAAKDPSLQRYRVERALARLSPVLSESLAALAGAGLTSQDLLPLARTLVRQLAFSGVTGTTLADALARAAVATLVEHIGARAVEERRAGTAASTEQELALFAEALAEPLA